MKLTDLWRSRKKPTLSFEVFPARTEKAAMAFEAALEELVSLEPDFFSVTFGAGGSTRDGSRQLVEKLINRKKAMALAYFACYGLGPSEITEVLDAYRGLGVENVLLVRGDEPQDGEKSFTPHPQSLIHASDLVSFVRPKYGFCIGVAGYPEKHVEAENLGKDLEHLKLKVSLGADYIIANYFYDNRFFLDFVDRCRKAGIVVPILPGVMPIYSVKMMETLAGICGATITEEVRQGLAALPPEDKEALWEWGVKFAAKQCRDLIKAGVPGIHLYTMDRGKSAAGIVGVLRSEGLL